MDFNGMIMGRSWTYNGMIMDDNVLPSGNLT